VQTEICTLVLVLAATGQFAESNLIEALLEGHVLAASIKGKALQLSFL